jgi:ATP-binding cassette subfamily B protein
MPFHNIRFLRRLGLAELKRSVGMVWRGSAKWMVVSLCLGAVQAMLPLASLYLLKRIIDAVVAGASKGIGTSGLHTISILIVCALGLQLLAALCKSFAQVVQEAQAEKVTEYMQDLLHRKAIEVDLEYYENPQFKDTFHRAQLEAPYRPTQIVQGLAQLTQNGLSLIAVSGFLLVSVQWIFALIIVVAAVPGLLVRFHQSKRMFHSQMERTPIQRRLEYYNWMLSSSQHAKENRLFGIGTVLRDRAAGLRHGLNERRLKFSFQKAAGEFTTQATGALVMFGAFGMLSFRAASGAISIGALVMVYQAFQRGLGYFQELFAALASLYENKLFVRDIHAFLDQEVSLPEPRNPRPIPRSFRHGIRFENVRFNYRGSDRPCLEDVSLTIKPGEVVALVGDNGVGKSTLIKLLCRMYDPVSGRITIDGIDIRQFKKAELRNAISVVFQDFVQYELPVRDNIWFGNITLPASDEAIIRSARSAGADAFIRKLNRGYDSILGTHFEGAEELSVGQWQKIALARAFLRPSELIVLDEPTSALDPKAEYEVFEKFRELAADRSTLLISHRLSTVKMADRIYVLSGGRIIEHGTHEELVELGTNYANLYNTQAASYR